MKCWEAMKLMEEQPGTVYSNNRDEFKFEQGKWWTKYGKREWTECPKDNLFAVDWQPKPPETHTFEWALERYRRGLDSKRIRWLPAHSLKQMAQQQYIESSGIDAEDFLATDWVEV